MSGIPVEVIKEASNSSSYDWSIAQLGKDELGRYWIRSGAGCSCNYIDDKKWEPLLDMQQVNFKLDSLEYEYSKLENKADFIMFAQTLFGNIK